MAELRVEIDPAAVGFDAARLTRIDTHFARYADDGRLPGWLILVSRAGRIVYLGRYGDRDLERRAPVDWETQFRIYSMTKPITAVAAMMLYEEGAFELKDPPQPLHPGFCQVPSLSQRFRIEPHHRTITRTDPHRAPPNPHSGFVLRISSYPSGRCSVPGGGI